ncbi:hypothetical protein [Sphingomonas sp. CROZ-RG-20F-R02-07]|uniref:hypothetical protein n=1 Tax=Sphingomonas sp. CROZ-RG-20F-R02-07 TaxID=2914832 RepID=UPI001F58AF9E|nr:hypothetical protein [Sphingomonas sp. CROZ-RG-20F-R02-07]
MNLAHLERLPDWPARMTAEIAAAYMGISKTTFLTRYTESGVREGSNVLWARIQLDAMIAKQFSIAQPAKAAANEDDSWDDLR